MNDYIIRGTAANDQVRFFAAYTKDVVETARQKHNWKIINSRSYDGKYV